MFKQVVKYQIYFHQHGVNDQQTQRDSQRVEVLNITLNGKQREQVVGSKFRRTFPVDKLSHKECKALSPNKNRKCSLRKCHELYKSNFRITLLHISKYFNYCTLKRAMLVKFVVSVNRRQGELILVQIHLPLSCQNVKMVRQSYLSMLCNAYQGKAHMGC